MAFRRPCEWIWPAWHHSRRSTHYHRALRALISSDTGWSQPFRIRLFFAVTTFSWALKVPQTCLKGCLDAKYIIMTNRTILAQVWASSSCVVDLNYSQNSLKPACQNTPVSHRYKLFWCTKGAANSLKWLNEGGRNKFDRPDTTHAGLLIIMVRCGPKLLAK